MANNTNKKKLQKIKKTISQVTIDCKKLQKFKMLKKNENEKNTHKCEKTKNINFAKLKKKITKKYRKF